MHVERMDAMTHRFDKAEVKRALARCCIIGAGVSGLSLAKAFRDRGVTYDCFEMSDRLGGVWAFKNPNGLSAAYRSLHIDTSKSRLAFEDFPAPKEWPEYPHHSQILVYLNDYARQFDLMKGITFSTEVTDVSSAGNARWLVSLSTGEILEYEAVFVCNGHHWDPRWPKPNEYRGNFSGIQMHSCEYVDPFEPHDMRGKRVLVVGMGNSAMDQACELCPRHIAERLFVSTRRGVYIFPRFMLGRAADKGKVHKWLPKGIQTYVSKWVYRRVVGRMENYGLPKPDHDLFESHGTVSDEFPSRAAAGDILIRPGIKEFDGDHVIFTDGSREKIDVIIWATGYNVTFPFFKDEFLKADENRLPLYKRMFKPDMNNLIFVGLLQSTVTIVTLAERQARFLSAYMAGDYALPSKQEMEAAIITDEKRHNGRYYASARHTMQVDQEIYHWELEAELRKGAKRVGKEPAA